MTGTRSASSISGMSTATADTFRALFTSLSAAIEAEDHILSAGRESLPECARKVLDDRDAVSPEYYAWLCEQVARMDGEAEQGEVVLTAEQVAAIKDFAAKVATRHRRASLLVRHARADRRPACRAAERRRRHPGQRSATPAAGRPPGQDPGAAVVPVHRRQVAGVADRHRGSRAGDVLGCPHAEA